MQFDHIQGKKEFNIADSFNLDKSIVQITLEMDKCDLVCACCHALKSYAERKDLAVPLFFATNRMLHKSLSRAQRMWWKVSSTWFAVCKGFKTWSKLL
jgi:hypothetical protein